MGDGDEWMNWRHPRHVALQKSKGHEPKELECDCCGKLAVLERCWPMGIETFACDSCRGVS